MTDSAQAARAALALGVRLSRQGQWEPAAQAFRRAVALRADDAQGHYNLGVALRALGQGEPAIAAFRAAIALRPDHGETHNNLGAVLIGVGRLDEGVAACRRAIALNPDHASAFNNLGAGLIEQDRIDEAIAAYRRAIALRPDYAEAYNNLGLALEQQGRLEEAAAAYRRAVELKPTYARALGHLLGLWPMDEAAFAALSAQLDRRDQLPPKDRAVLLFAQGKALEHRGRHDRAFASLAEANAICRAGVAFDIAAVERWMTRQAETFDGALLQKLNDTGVSDRRPIFIVGMPRSGTTLVEQIVSAHAQVQGAGEIGALRDAIATMGNPADPAWAQGMTGADAVRLGEAYLQRLPPIAPGQTRITDKRPSNFLHVGLIAACLPDAIIIHCQRDPRDACLSCFATPFADGQDFTHDLTELGRYWRAYDRLMDHWRTVLPPGRMLEVPYEAVVADVEGWARRLIAHCGLEWDDVCLRFHESGRVVRTASAAQVRRPIYAGSVGRWRRFAGHLGPLLAALGAPWDKDMEPREPEK